ncbi:MAG: hypothetical protein JRD93_10675 [Deltaproteobacteria bacterium]|nr:hypothetical protein [Deltaproteobacteria bacterium]MBW2662430.1 hypothetical protein [Deltaproteobacteria bacterium]
MSFNQNPLFRKIIIPWYDSEMVCFIMIAFMFFVLIFSVTGILVAYEKVEYSEHIWLPIILVIMSGLVIVSTAIRLIKRYLQQLPK